MNIFDHYHTDMENNRPVFYRNATFFWLYLVWFTGLSCIVMFTTKEESFLFINRANYPFFDIFFTIFTFMGDGIFIIALALVLFQLKYKRLALGLFSSYIIAGLIARVIKKLINFQRPAGFLSDPSIIHNVPWIMLSHHNSFPSGHITSVFAAAVTISLYTGKRSLAIITLIIASLVAYSRIYLGQHFVEDVWAGSFLGVMLGTLCFMLQEKFLANSYKKPNWG